MSNSRSAGQCNCEHSKCYHYRVLQRPCGNRAVTGNKVQYIGPVCDSCYAMYDKQYHLPKSTDQHSALMLQLKRHVQEFGIEARDHRTQVEMVAYDAGWAGRKIEPWLRALGDHFKVDVEAEWVNGREDRDKE